MHRFRLVRPKHLLVALFLLTVAGVAGYAAVSVWQFREMAREWYQPLPDGANVQEQAEPPPPVGRPLTPHPPFTLLLIGVDSRMGERARSDAMILAALHPVKRRAHLLSIPRDTYLELPGRGADKLNHAMAYGGPALVKQAVERFFHIRIDHYMTIDFEGFRRLVDELGGVEVEVRKRMKYTDPSDGTRIDLKPGRQVLTGQQALDYARFRKSDAGPADSDYERMQRQQEILRALAEKGGELGMFLKAFKLMDILGKHVKTDLTEDELASLLAGYAAGDPPVLTTETLKGVDRLIGRGAAARWFFFVPGAERERVRTMVQQVLAGE